MIFMVLNRKNARFQRAGCRPHPDGNSNLWTSQGLRPALRRLPDQWGDDDVSEKRFEGGRIGFSVFHVKLWMELGFSSVWVCLCFKHFRRVNVQTIQSNVYFVRAGIKPLSSSAPHFAGVFTELKNACPFDSYGAQYFCIDKENKLLEDWESGGNWVDELRKSYLPMG